MQTMDDAIDRPLPPPPEGTLTVEHGGAETSVTLRSRGGSRLDAARTFGLLSLWGLIEALSIVLISTFPWVHSADHAVFAVFLALWSVVGPIFLCKRAYALWGRDVLLLREKEWTVWRGCGPFGVTRTFARRSVNFLELNRRNDLGFQEEWIEARVDGKLVQLVTHGSRKEREWVLELLQQERMRDAPSARLSIAAEKALSRTPALPTGWSKQTLPDLSLRVIPPRSRGMGLSWGLTYGAFTLSVQACLRLLHDWRSTGGFDPHMLLTASPFIAGGLVLAGLAAWFKPGEDEWRVDQDRLLIIRRRFGREQVKHLTGSTLALEDTTSGTSTTWSLVVWTKRERRVLETTLAGRKLSDLRALGELLSQHTGWSLQIPPEAGG